MQSLPIAIFSPLLISVLVYLYVKRKFQIKEWSLLNKAFILGILSIVVMILFDQFARIMEWNDLRSLKRTGFYSFVVIGFGAELGKFIVLRYIFLPNKQFRGPVEGIIYSLVISLGFTLAALPMFAVGVFSKPVLLPFIIFYPIANVAFALITGFFIGLGKLRRNRLIDSFSGLGIASFLHGFFFFVNLTDEYTIYLLFGLGTLFIATILLLKARNMKSEEAKS